MKTFKNAKVGDKVTDIMRGKGVICEINKDDEFSIYVNVSDVKYTYDINGFYCEKDKTPSLYYGNPTITGNKTREEACPINWEKVEQDTKIITESLNIRYFAAYIKKSDKVLYFCYGNKSNAFDDVYFIDSEKVKLYHE